MPRTHKSCAESKAVRLLTKSRHILSRRELYNLSVIAGEVGISQSRTVWFRGRRAGFCTPLSFLYSKYWRQEMRGNAQNLHLTHSNSECTAKSNNDPVDAPNTVVCNF